MPRILSAEQIQGSLSARYPAVSQPGQVDSISAAGAETKSGKSDQSKSGEVSSIQAASFKGFAAVAGKLKWVQAIEHFFQSGELILKDDFVQVAEDDAKRLTAAGRALTVSDEEVAKAQSGATGASASTKVAKAQSGTAA